MKKIFEKKIKKNLLILSGSICVALGFLGIFLPLLPTTPFLLLAAFCYAKSSNNFYQWLISNCLFGHYIKNYQEGKGLPLKEKIFTIFLLWLTMGYSCFFVVTVLWLKFLLISIGILVTIHIATY